MTFIMTEGERPVRYDYVYRVSPAGRKLSRVERIDKLLGVVRKCPRCGEEWPSDGEFFFQAQCYCRACFVEYKAERYGNG